MILLFVFAAVLASCATGSGEQVCYFPKGKLDVTFKNRNEAIAYCVQGLSIEDPHGEQRSAIKTLCNDPETITCVSQAEYQKRLGANSSASAFAE